MKEIALVLSGGGARGIAHIGVIRELESRGYVIKELAGTSMGAIVASVYASGKMEEFEDYLTHMDVKEVIKLLDFTLKMPGLIKANKIVRQLGKFVRKGDLSGLPLPVTLIATDLRQKKEVVWRSGDLLTAVHSSFAIPFVFAPVYVDDAVLVDGGVTNNFPLNRVSGEYPVFGSWANAFVEPDDDLKKLIKTNHHYKQKKSLLDAYLSKFYRKPKGGNKMTYAQILDYTLKMIVGQNTEHTIAHFPPEVLFEIPVEIAGTFDFLKAANLIRVGREVARRSLDEYEKTVS